MTRQDTKVQSILSQLAQIAYWVEMRQTIALFVQSASDKLNPSKPLLCQV